MGTATKTLHRTTYGLPTLGESRRMPARVVAWIAAVLVTAAFGWLAVRWADRNL